MKKTINKSLLILLVVLMAAVLLVGCAKKPAVTNDDFVNKAQALGYELYDVTPEESEYDYVKTAYSAEKTGTDEDHWLVRFVVAETKQDAEEMFNNNMSEYSNGVSTNVSFVSGSNYASYQADKDGQFVFVSYVDNTMLCIEVDQEYKDEAKTLIDTLDY